MARSDICSLVQPLRGASPRPLFSSPTRLLAAPLRRALPLILLLLACQAGRSRAQMLDLNANGMSDIWELMYGASALNPLADSDGDGMVNVLESLAGTNPFDSNSVPRIPVQGYYGTNFFITMPGQLGKLYQLQSTIRLTNGASWSNESSLELRYGSNVTLNAPYNSNSPKYFRIAISDVDPLNHGLNDWEEYQLGLDPTKTASSGQLDTNGQPLGDYSYVVGKLASQNVINIAASDPTAVQPDPGQLALSPGAFTVNRGGFPLNSITVNLTVGGPGPGFAVEGLDLLGLPRSVTFPVGASSEIIALTPLPNANLLAPVIASLRLTPGLGYSIGPNSNASVVIYPSTTGLGSGLTGSYYTNASATYSNSANFNPANLLTNRTDAAVDFNWGTNTSPPITNNGNYSVRWTGQIQPQYSEQYYFDVYSADGVKLWINDQLVIDDWVSRSPGDQIGAITLQGGTRYNLKLDYFVRGKAGQTHLYWYSPSQPRQIIPASALYPATIPPAPTTVTSALAAYGFLNQSFAFAVTGANSPTSFAAAGLPPGLAINFSTGLISGTPTLAGDFNVSLTASNSIGLSASALDIQIFDTGSSVTREVWLNVPGTNISDIPLTTPASLTNALAALEGVTNYGQNYGERVTGYLTAPATGNYYFWIAGSDSAELWISDNAEQVNRVRRATANSTAPHQWTLQSSQKSGWLSLVAGQKYYLEILHKAGAATNDNWSVAWLLDPTGTNTVPSGMVPGYLLSRYFAAPPLLVPGTLYAANLLAQAGVNSTGQGSATLRLSADGSQAILKFTATGLSSKITGEHIHCDPYLTYPSQIMFDIDATPPQPDGSYVWNITPIGAITNAADIIEIIKEGKAYINIHTANYPGGEINGHFNLAQGSQTFAAPPASPLWNDDHANSNSAARFLTQSTFGPSPADIATVQSLGYAGWINNQFSLPVAHHLPVVYSNSNVNPQFPFQSSLTFNAWWQQSITAPDQLRQRIAFALSEIMVISQQGVLQNNSLALSSYYDTLLDNSFGNFRDLLKSATLSPAMGIYLDMRANLKGDITKGTHADENYAREIMQLFSIGLNRMWPDGSLTMDSTGNLVPTYDQNTIMGFAAVFTGWDYFQTNQANGRLPNGSPKSANYTNAMVLIPTRHDLATKRLLDNVVLPAAQGAFADPNNTNYDSYGGQDLESALDSIFNNQNVGPYICRQLIQRLVTSSPSPGYVYRVVQKFNDNGNGIRGDMQAVIRAILLDYEARATNFITVSTYGKMREPVLRVTAPARAFAGPPPITGAYGESGTRAISVTTDSSHRLNNNDTVNLLFTETTTNTPPPAQGYAVTVTTSNTFTINLPTLIAATYGQSNNTITVTNSGHGLQPGYLVYLQFTSGGAIDGVFSVDTVPTNTVFTVIASDSATRKGNCIFPRLSGAGYVQSGTNITVSINGTHGLNPGDFVFIHFTSGSAATTNYVVTSIPDATHFVVATTVSNNQTRNSLTAYPLQLPAMNHAGTVIVQYGTGNFNATDTGTSAALAQTPLNSPTVFNFFFPTYRFPGTLASAGLTTPEFQLTSDSSVALQMNYLEGGILGTNSNVNGLSSFQNGNGSLYLDLNPWINSSTTSDAGIPGLVDTLSGLLMGGELSTGARSIIINYVANQANYPFGSPPTAAQMDARARAVVHLLISSPDYIIQR